MTPHNHFEPHENPPLVNSAHPPQLDLITTRGGRASASAQGNGARDSDTADAHHESFANHVNVPSPSSATLSEWDGSDYDSDCDMMSIIDGDEGANSAIDEFVNIYRHSNLARIGIPTNIDEYESPIGTPMLTSSVLAEPDSGEQSMRSSTTRSSRSSGSISPAGHVLLDYVGSTCYEPPWRAPESYMIRPLPLIPEERYQHEPIHANEAVAN